MNRALEPVRLGVVGLGNFGQWHAQTIAGLAEAQLAAVVDRDHQRLEKAPSGVRQWTSLDQALAQSDAEAWVIAASTVAHVSLARTILNAGLPVLLEKPISESLSEAESLRPLIRSDSSNLMLGHTLLFNSEFAYLRAEVQHRGTIRYINSIRHRPVALIDRVPYENPLTLLMVHDLYVTQVLMNRAEPTDFSCHLRFNETRADLAIAQIAWGNTTFGSFATSFLTPEGMPPDGFDRLEVFGDGWAARSEPNPRPIEIWDAKAQWPAAQEISTSGRPPTGMLAEELRCYCRVVRGIHAPPIGTTYEDGLQVQRWLDRLESADRESRC